MEIFTPCGYHSAQHPMFVLCHIKRVEVLATVALHVLRKSGGKSCVLLALVDKVCSWSLAGSSTSPGTGSGESMTCLRHHFSFWKTVVLLLVELCSLWFKQPCCHCAHWNPLALGSPLYFSCCFLLLLFDFFLLLSMRLIITTKMPKILP